MQVLIAQILIGIFAVSGLALFVHVHLFSGRRLRRVERVAMRDDARLDGQLALSGADAPPSREALFYMHHEQVRRFIDAKIDIIRSAAETQNRLLLMGAKAVCEGVGPDAPMMLAAPPGVAPRMLAAPGAESAEPVEIPVAAESAPSFTLADQLRAARAVAHDHLAEIDQQISALSSPDPALQASRAG